MVSGDVVVVSGQSRAWKVWLDRQRETPESTHHAARRGGGMGQGAWGREGARARGARLAWKGGTEYRPPTVVPKRYSQKMSGVKTALTTARPAAPAQRQSTHGMLRKAGVGGGCAAEAGLAERA